MLVARLTAGLSLVISPCLLGCSSESKPDAGAGPIDASTRDAVQLDAEGLEGGSRAAPDAQGGPITGPITGGEHGLPFNPMPEGMAETYDYVEQEYFIEGTATSFVGSGEWTADGRWAVSESETAPFKTRFLVRRPRTSQAFNGTVVVEWLNVSAGMDSDPDFGQAHPEILRSGYAYVGVSAQRTGVEGGGGLIPIEGVAIRALKEWDTERYGTLAHPGDDFSYDIFTQVIRAVRDGASDVLGGLEVEQVIAAGESQSAMRMVSYVNAVHPVARAVDGFLIHSRGGSGAPVDADGDAMPADARIRDDLEEPVFQFQTETDLFVLGSYSARQPDTDRLVTWEVAGTAHADRATLDYGVASGSRAEPGRTSTWPVPAAGSTRDRRPTPSAKRSLRSIRG